MPAKAARTAAPIQFLKFLVVGAVNTVFGYGVFALLILSGVAPMPALVLAYVVGVLFNFVTTGRFVFQGATRSAFIRFVAAYGATYVINLGLYKLLEAAAVMPLVAQALCLPFVVVFSFFLFKHHVFKNADKFA